MENEQYYELGEKTDTNDIIIFFKERLADFALAVDPKFYFQANTKQKKQLIKISKIPDQYVEKMKADFLVQVNPSFFDAFLVDSEIENINEILFDQEIDKIKIDKNGKFSYKAKNIKASRGIIQKYNFDDVARAEEIEEKFEEQKKDQES